MNSIHILPEAELDVFIAAQWYEEQAEGLGRRFVDCIGDELEFIRDYPASTPIWYKKVRLKVVKGFPYLIYIQLTDKAIFVLAIFHAKRNQRHIFRDRIKNIH